MNTRKTKKLYKQLELEVFLILLREAMLKPLRTPVEPSVWTFQSKTDPASIT